MWTNYIAFEEGNTKYLSDGQENTKPKLDEMIKTTRGLENRIQERKGNVKENTSWHDDRDGELSIPARKTHGKVFQVEWAKQKMEHQGWKTKQGIWSDMQSMWKIKSSGKEHAGNEEHHQKTKSLSYRYG